MKPLPLLAELLGTCVLTLVVRLSLLDLSTTYSTPVLAALTLGLLVYTLGSVSGAHFNPAVTISMLSVGKIQPIPAILYIIMQLLGATIAMALTLSSCEVLCTVASDAELMVGVAEAFGAFLFVFGIHSVVVKRAPSDASGIVIGTSLFLGIHIASAFSKGILNPAVATGTGSLTLPYILGPIVGGVLGAWASKGLTAKKARA